MHRITKRPIGRLGYDFVAPEYLPPGADEYYLRDLQQRRRYAYRGLTAGELEVLVRNENTADDWAAVQVTDRFDPELVKRCQFFGRVRLGALEDYYLEFHDLRLPVGLYNSTIIACDIGANVAIHNVACLAHYILGDEVILLNVDEMLTTSYAKFGNGIVKEGESERVRIWLALGNENGGRGVAPFDGMRPADAFLWCKYRGDARLMARFLELTDARGDRRRGWYGEVGDRTIIKDCRILKDVRIGSDCYIKGANKLKNLTIHSSAAESSQIGEGVELVNGIVGYGCRIFYGVKAVRFVLGSNSSLKYGARLIHGLLGDNSTVSCCEVLNSLIFPGHEQHHNNSFLCAALVLGQSNVAAGVTAGSNHNSRAPDGELVAGRGFWPGLCVSLKHNSRFASFTLLAKAAYPAELDIPLPFALVSRDEGRGELRVLPAYWFLYNLYALARNAWKYAERDRRVHKGQPIEFDPLAPDTVEEMFTALALLETWTGQAVLRREGRPAEDVPEAELRARGRGLLRGDPQRAAALEVLAPGLENSPRPARILKVAAAYACYRDMIHFYSARTLVRLLLERDLPGVAALRALLEPARRGRWLNVGGQLMLRDDVEALKEGVKSGAIDSWDALHAEYDRLWQRYPLDRARHALASLLDVNELEPARLDAETWRGLLDRADAIARTLAERTRASRAKDYAPGFRRLTYDSPEEMQAVLGRLEDDEFIRRSGAESAALRAAFAAARARG